jgi:isopenicillin N synthase-like dioxygenase
MERLQVPAIPVVDLETIRGDGADTKGGNPRELFEAFRDVGFAYVKGHGIPETLIQEAFEWV